MNQPDANESNPVTPEFIASLLKEMVAKISIPDPSEEMPGGYLIGVFGVDFEWVHLKQPDALGREKMRVHMIAEEQAESLVDFAETHPDAFDLACYIGGSHWGLVGNGNACSESIRCFSARVLCGAIKRPKRKGRPKGAKTYLRILQYSLCRWVEENSTLTLTRNASPSGDAVSACDLVADSFSEAGMHVTYSQLLDVCQKENFKEIREMSIRFSQKEPLPTLRQE